MDGDLSSYVEMNAEEEGDSGAFLLRPTDGDSPELDFRISPLKSFRSEGSRAIAPNDNYRCQFSHPDVLKENQRQKPYCLSPKNAEGKENRDMMVLENNSGIYTSLEKLVPARKGKRAGGCNLRKSLAWNMAFSTEEGILNRQELSILTGSSQSFLSREGECKHSAVSGSSFEDTSESRALEEKSHEKPAPRLQVKEQRLAGPPSMPRSSTQEEPLMRGASKGSQLAIGINRSLLQGGGCPQPSASYAKKRHTCTNATIGMSKIPKLVSSKVSSTHHLPSKNNVTTTNGSNYNKNGTPVNAEKNLQSSSTNAGKNAVCPTSAKSSVLGCGKQVANQLSEQPLAKNLLSAHGNKGIMDLKMAPDSKFLAADKHASTKHMIPSSIEALCPQQDDCHSGNHLSAKHPTKPSGLRMPSPSLGYFRQTKVTASHSALKLQPMQQCNLPVCCDHPLGKLNGDDISWLSSPYTMINMLPKLSPAAVAQTIGVATPSQQIISSLNNRVPSIAALGSQMIQKPNSKTKELWIMGVNNSCISGTLQETNSQQLPLDNCSGIIIEEQNLKQYVRSPKHDHSEIKQAFHEETGKLLTVDGMLLNKSRYSNKQQVSNDCENVSDVMQKGTDSGRFELLKFSSSQSSSKQVIGDVSCQQEEVVASDACLGEYQGPSNGYPLQENTMHPNLQFEGTSICDIDQVSCLVAESMTDEKKTDHGISKSSESSLGSSKEIHTQHQAESPTSEMISLGVDSELMSNHSPIETQDAPSGNHKQSDADGIHSNDHTLARKDDIAATTVRKATYEVLSKDLVPFSDDWLAARVAVGEDILTMKTGAVQNSPPEKSLPEPSPWSPVKRSNQDLGPFDCTKYTNLQLINSSKPLE